MTVATSQLENRTHKYRQHTKTFSQAFHLCCLAQQVSNGLLSTVLDPSSLKAGFPGAQTLDPDATPGGKGAAHQTFELRSQQTRQEVPRCLRGNTQHFITNKKRRVQADNLQQSRTKEPSHSTAQTPQHAMKSWLKKEQSKHRKLQILIGRRATVDRPKTGC